MKDKIQEIEKNIELLELQIKEERLKLELERVKRTKIEETIIERRTIVPYVPQAPFWYNGTTHDNNNITLC